MPEEASPTHIDELKKRIDLKIHVQAEMRWLMGRILAKLLSRQLPKGFSCRYEKYGEVGWNRGEAFSDKLVVFDETGIWVIINIGYLLGRPIPHELWINDKNEFSFITGRSAHRQLLEVLRQWVDEFELTSNIDEIIKKLEHYGVQAPMELERARRRDRKERAKKVRTLTQVKPKPKSKS